MRFATIDIFTVTTFFALIAWRGIPATLTTLIHYVAAVSVVGMIASVRFRQTRPHVAAIVSGLVFFAVSLACWWSHLWIGYFSHVAQPNGPLYFEDGIIAEGIVYPFVYFVVYGPVVAAAALLASAAQTTLRSGMQRLPRSCSE